jgi:hypothetical protein
MASAQYSARQADLQNLLQLGNQRREVFGYGAPDDVVVHQVVAVDQSVARADDLRPGNPGCCWRSDSGMWLAASPMISRQRSVAKPKVRSGSRSARFLSRISPIASRAYSSRCCNRTWGSCRGIKRLGFGQHPVTEMPAEAQRRIEVHLAPAEQRRQFEFHPGQSKQARDIVSQFLELIELLHYLLRTDRLHVARQCRNRPAGQAIKAHSLGHCWQLRWAYAHLPLARAGVRSH